MKKLASRKFLAFIIYTIIFPGLFIISAFTEQLNVSSKDLVQAMIWLIGIYVGGNVASSVIKSIWFKDGMK